LWRRDGKFPVKIFLSRGIPVLSAMDAKDAGDLEFWYHSKDNYACGVRLWVYDIGPA
jgi:hypothetical protein